VSVAARLGCVLLRLGANKPPMRAWPRPWSLDGFAGALSALLVASAAHGQSVALAASEPAPNAPTPPVTDSVRTPESTDLTAGHLTIFPSAGYTWPFGALEPGTSYASRTPGGLALGLDADFGVSRSASVGVWGSAGLLSSASDCGCTVQSFAGGPVLRYRLVQGMRFDPWVAVGAGYRMTAVEGDSSTRFTGIDWLHAALGGDWYAASGLAFGPLVSADFGTFTSPRTAFHWQFTLGLRIGLDVPGR
jgi:hypothetical protein